MIPKTTCTRPLPTARKLFLALAASLMVGFGQPLAAAEPQAFDTWARTARIGGAAVWIGMTDTEMDTLLNNLAAQNVSVIEADSDLSNYLTDADFDQELALISHFTQKAHAHPNRFKVVWYYPSLEVLTPNAAGTPHTMAKDHPDWVQKGLDGTPNVFVGGTGQVFWVDPGMESAWMSPSSPYRDYFYARVAKIVQTGVDGLWADVPLYSDFGPVRWSDSNFYAATQFEAATGARMPTQENWADANWRRWISWRHDELRRFLADAATVARQSNPEFAFIVETLPTEYNMSTVYGLEGAELRSIEGVSHVWEVDTLSNNSAMRKAREDDWISYISMQKFIKAASRHKPAWSFAYGKQADDAELVMAEILAAGNNPYELKIPQMTTTVGAAFRSRMFGWVKANEGLLWRNSAARVGVLYSPPSRDFVDQAKGEGMYVTTTSGGDSLWWSDNSVDSAYQRQYVAEYRGMVKLLVHNHIPFDLVVKPTGAADLARYQSVVIPDYEALSDTEAQMIRDYVANGGRVIVTGPNPGGMDPYGNARTEYALADVLGVKKGSALPAAKVQAYGAGEARFFSGLLGKKYFTNAADAATAASTLLTAIGQTSAPWLTTDANKKVHMELSQGDNQLILQYVNFIGVTGTFTVVPTTVSTTLNIPAGKAVQAVEATSPDNTTAARSPLAFSTNANGSITFSLPVKQYSLVVVTLQDTGSSSNQPPVARADSYTTAQDQALVVGAPGLLANDSDADGDALTVSSTSASPQPAHGTVSIAPNGAFTYTPAAGYSGSDSFGYSISDGRGGTATATATVTVTASTTGIPAQTAYPTGVTILTGSLDYGTMAGLKTADADTYDVNSAFVTAAAGGVTDWYASTKVSATPGAVTQIAMTYVGQYSKTSVTQQISLFNFTTNSWDLMDTRTVGNSSDITVKLTPANPSSYISATGEMRARVRGFRAGASTTTAWKFFCWANQLKWDVK